MEVSLIILGLLIVTGAVLYIHHRLTAPEDRNVEPEAKPEPDEGCCGMHITCERDSLSPVFDESALYFDDEELDAYVSFAQDQYNEADIEIFREVLLTLRPEDIAPWARSIQLRGIELPDAVRDELFIMVEEMRNENVAV